MKKLQPTENLIDSLLVPSDLGSNSDKVAIIEDTCIYEYTYTYKYTYRYKYKCENETKNTEIKKRVDEILTF